MNEIEVLLSNEICLLEFIKSVYPDSQIREVSSDSYGELNKLTIELKSVELFFSFGCWFVNLSLE